LGLDASVGQVNDLVAFRETMTCREGLCPAGDAHGEAWGMTTRSAIDSFVWVSHHGSGIMELGAGQISAGMSEKGTSMGRCSNCQFENVADASACARCGQRLTTGDPGTPTGDGAATLPDWMRSVQSGVDRRGEAGVALLQTGGVAAAATLPVQVRRSRVPVLSVGGPALTTTADAAFIGSSAPGFAPATGDDETAAPRLGNRLRMILLVAIVVALILFILARLAMHGGA
jgi:hypothetical protein